MLKDKRTPTTLSEIAISRRVYILDATTNIIKKQGTYRDLKKEWKDEELFYSRLRELMAHKLIYIT